MAYATAEQIIDAIKRANTTRNMDGTYHIIPTWVGNQRVFMAERVTQEITGYEVAYQAAQGGTNLNVIVETERWGYWEDQGIVFLDRTVHIDAPAGVALDIARLYAQEAVYSWATGECIPTTDPATGLDWRNLEEAK